MSDVFVASGSIKINVNEAIENFRKVDEAAKHTTNNLDKTTSKSSSWTSKLSGIGTKLSLGVTAPLIALGVASFKAASDLNESISKTSVIFGTNAQVIQDWSKTSTDAFGASQGEALEMVSKYGAMGSAMGLNANQTKDYSMNLTQLAGDMASFNNISIDRANEALTGVYTGETEALKSQGIIMSQTNLQHFAESQGIHKKIQNMSQAEQVQLRYNYVMDQTKDAQGDYKRTSEGAANTSKKLVKSIDNLQASFGQFLIELTPVIRKITDLINYFNGLSNGTKITIIWVLAFAAALGPTIKILTSFGKGVSGTVKFLKAFPGGIKKSIDGVKNFTKATKEGSNFIGKFGSGVVNATKKVSSFTIGLAKSAKKGLVTFGKSVLNCLKSIGKFTLAIIKNTAMVVKNGAVWLASKVKLLAFKAAQLAVAAATKAMTIAQYALNLAMSLNPIGIVIAILLALAAVFVTLYNKCDWFREGVNNIWDFIKSIFTGFSDFLNNVFTRDWTKSFGVFGNIINAFMRNIKNVFDGVKRIFGGIVDFVTGVFTGNWSQAWQGVVSIFGGIFDTLGAVAKAPLNAIIGLINMAIDGINSISIDIPSWVPFVGGKHFGSNFGHIDYLYSGAVFDQPTLLGNNTVVGDKFKGAGNQREYVLPEPMIRKVVGETVRNEIGKLGIYLDGRSVGQVIARYKDEMDEYNRNLNPILSH